MTTLRLERKYEDNLTYPFYIRHVHFELTGKQIKEYDRNRILPLNIGEYSDLLERIERLEALICK